MPHGPTAHRHPELEGLDPPPGRHGASATSTTTARGCPPRTSSGSRALVIPPAWQDVWICPTPNGHIQAVGVDAAGRRQYLYHPDWRIKRDAMKFDRVLEVAPRALQDPRVGARAPRPRRDAAGAGRRDRRTPAGPGVLPDRVSDAYADDNGSFGLTTLERRHVTRARASWSFCFVGKSGVEHCIEIDDPLSIAAVETMRRRRGTDLRLLAYQDRRRWASLDATRVNEYLRSLDRR